MGYIMVSIEEKKYTVLVSFGFTELQLAPDHAA